MLPERPPMTAQRLTDVDPITEFRLRHWARQNYVTAEDRSPTWHRVVLDEMSRRDVELEESDRQTTAGATYVPLPPSDSELRRVDEPHDSSAERTLIGGRTSRPSERQHDVV